MFWLGVVVFFGCMFVNFVIATILEVHRKGLQNPDNFDSVLSDITEAALRALSIGDYNYTGPAVYLGPLSMPFLAIWGIYRLIVYLVFLKVSESHKDERLLELDEYNQRNSNVDEQL